MIQDLPFVFPLIKLNFLSEIIMEYLRDWLTIIIIMNLIMMAKKICLALSTKTVKPFFKLI